MAIRSYSHGARSHGANSLRPDSKKAALDRDQRKTVRSFTATSEEMAMLAAVARYHGFSKSATLTSLVKREFWRLFPRGNEEVRLTPGARVVAPGARVVGEPGARVAGKAER